MKNKKNNVVLDIPLLLENNILKKKVIYVFVRSKKREIKKRILKRPNYDDYIYKIVKKNQLNLDYKRKISKFVISNNFKKSTILKQINVIKSLLDND